MTRSQGEEEQELQSEASLPMFVRTRSASPVLQRANRDMREDLWFVSGVPSDDGGTESKPFPIFFSQKPMQFKWEHMQLRKMFFHIAVTFNAGFLNAVAYSTPEHLPVNMVTGHSTLIGQYQFNDEDRHDGLGQHAYIILCFFLGAMIPGLFSMVNDESPAPRYGAILSIANVILVLALIVELHSDAHYAFLYLCACSAGFQNSMISIFSGHSYRTTHLTGTTTDTAIVLCRTLFVGYYQDSKKLFQLIPSILAYISGGAAGYAAYHEWKRQSIVINMAILALVSVYLSCWPKAVQWLQPEPEPEPEASNKEKDIGLKIEIPDKAPAGRRNSAPTSRANSLDKE
jgi:uncharacterized membrane protein YoaK (UPF0700 family)